MNGHSRFYLACIVVLLLLAAHIGHELTSFAASPSSTVRVVPSRCRVNPGQTIEFNLELTDSQGNSRPIPRSERPPQLLLYDSQEQQIGTYNFRFG